MHFGKLGLVHADDLTIRAGGIRERTEGVEDGAEGQLSPHGPACFIAGWKAGANMKPMPTSLMERATSSGVCSTLTPSASSTSAEPHLLLTERFPCLAIATPAPAATNAAAVEILKVFTLSPPVPQVSTSGRREVDTGRTCSRIAGKLRHLFHRLTLHPEGDKEGGDQGRTRLPGHDLGHGGCVGGAEVVAFGQFAYGVAGHGLFSGTAFNHKGTKNGRI